MSWHQNLTEKQRKFVEAYVGQAKGNATEAARLAGYSGNNMTLRSMGKENLTKPHILEGIESYRADMIKNQSYPMLTADRIHREWLELLDDTETTRTQKIDLLRDAARANGMFTDNYRIEEMLRIGRAEEWDPEGEMSAEDYVKHRIDVQISAQ